MGSLFKGFNVVDSSNGSFFYEDFQAQRGMKLNQPDADSVVAQLREDVNWYWRIGTPTAMKSSRLRRLRGG